VVDAKTGRPAGICEVKVERIEPKLEPAGDGKRLERGKEIARLASRNSVDFDIGTWVIGVPVAGDARGAQDGVVRNSKCGSIDVVPCRAKTTLVGPDPARARRAVVIRDPGRKWK